MQPNDNSMDKNVNWKLQRFLKSMHNLNSSCCISQIQLRTDIREAVSASRDRSDIGCWHLQKSLWLFVSHLNYRAIPQEISKLTWERCMAMKVKNNAEGCILGVTQRRAVNVVHVCSIQMYSIQSFITVLLLIVVVFWCQCLQSARIYNTRLSSCEDFWFYYIKHDSHKAFKSRWHKACPAVSTEPHRC